VHTNTNTHIQGRMHTYTTILQHIATVPFNQTLARNIHKSTKRGQNNIIEAGSLSYKDI